MSNALMAKFNMKEAKDEKVGFTKKTVYTAIKGIYASSFYIALFQGFIQTCYFFDLDRNSGQSKF